MMITKALQALFSENRIFCSEADFQFALAWKIKELNPAADIRLEYIPWLFDKNMHIDIVVFIDGQMIPVELKYKTKGFIGTVGKESVYLKDQSAQDLGRYDFLHDVQRMEKITYSRIYPIKKAYSILLTNDQNYWEIPGPRKRERNDEEFRIHEGTVIHGEKNWKSGTGSSTKKYREEPIILRGTYTIKWNDYILILACPFKFTIVETDR